MRAIKKAEKIIEKDITKPFAKVLAHLILSLESNKEFHIKDLYELPPEQFDLVIEVLKWMSSLTMWNY